ncbi:unnamed protein product [Caenorhabditis angaria]|uniref:BTB domain-containing protein n=1 Tax=Caenorhabditis angaria TaxID=860376 RepID=A0A9P1I7X5_9PELO|nr:unnamed protein product [Caenorhabditis angaria]
MNPIVFNGNKLRWKFGNIWGLSKEGFMSEKFKIGHIDWIINISHQYDYMMIDLKCTSENEMEKNWICEMSGKFRLLKHSGDGKHIITISRGCYHAGLGTSPSARVIKWYYLLLKNESLILDDQVYVEIDFNFNYYDFSKHIENITDMIVTVNDTEFHLNKWALGSRSKYFQDLIINNLPGETKNVKLENITEHHFCLMLASFYPFFETNLELYYPDLLEVAEFYGVPSLHQKIEQYLLVDTELNVIEKIKYAEKYGYENLMEQSIDSLKTGLEIKFLQADREFMALKDTTKLRIMNRLLDFV